MEDQVLKFAKAHQADLIVIGVQAPEQALTAVTHLAHSQAEHIVAQAPCPVLTVRG
jgi:nucleotide-binding universal stress UspA family protein